MNVISTLQSTDIIKDKAAKCTDKFKLSARVRWPLVFPQFFFFFFFFFLGGGGGGGGWRGSEDPLLSQVCWSPSKKPYANQI